MSNTNFVRYFLNAIFAGVVGRAALTVKTEFEIAKIEMKVKGRELGKGIALIVVAAGFAFFMLGTLVAAAVLALSMALEPWVAALIVAGGLFFWVLVLGAWGAYKVKKNKDLMPTASIERIKDSVGA